MDGTRNRPGHSTSTDRRSKKLAGKTSWFKGKKTGPGNISGGAKGVSQKNQETARKDVQEFTVETAIFVPHTPKGELRARLSKMEQEMGMKGRYKYVERLGSTVGDLLVKADPWKEHCGRKMCLPCQSAPGKYGKQGVVYSITCETCREQGLTCQYRGGVCQDRS